MKVLFDTEIFDLQLFGGISLYFSKLYDYFSKDEDVNYDIPVIYSNNQYIRNSKLPEIKSYYGKDFIFRKQLTNFYTQQNKIKTKKELMKQNFDIFHPTYNISSNFLKYLNKKPFVLTVHDMTVEVLPEYFIFDKNTENTIKTKKILIEKASRIIAISENTKKDILELTNVDESKIDIIYHGKPFESVDKTINAYCIDYLPNKYILFVGQRSKYKNFVSFVSAISEILLNDEDLFLVCAGGFNFSHTEREIIDSLNLTNKVIYTGIENEGKLITLYKNAVCFAFPSLYEGFGFPLLESFQSGCPLVCSNTSSFLEVAGGAAEYFDPYNTESIKNAVNKVIYDKELKNEMIQKGYSQAEKFNWEKTTQETKNTYRKAIYG